jgi:hypothetical protein
MEKQYKSPLVLREVGVETETSFLLGSIVDNVGAVESTGQEVTEYNFSDNTQFNHTWE